MNKLLFRRAQGSDVETIMEIINDAQKDLKKLGIDQWQNNYPNTQSIIDDIESKNSYVIKKDSKVIATAAIIFGVEITYNTITDGKWLSSQDYVTIHRIAVSNNYRGQNIAREIIKGAEVLALKRDIKSIRVDTHHDNLAMQKFLFKNNFVYCGIIFLSDGSKRLAYEKILL